MRVDLPGGAWADIRGRDEITERQFRLIDRAETKTVNLVARLLREGYVTDLATLPEEAREAADLRNIELVTGLSDADQDLMDGYQVALIVGLATGWSFGDISEDTI